MVTFAVPAFVSKSPSAVAGVASNHATSAPAGICSDTVSLEPTGKLPARRQDHVDGSDPAALASVLNSGPPLTRKVNSWPMYCGVSVSLQILRSPTVPPAGWFVKVTRLSLLAVEPAATKTIAVRFGKSLMINLLLGLVVMSATSVAGLVGSSTMRFA